MRMQWLQRNNNAQIFIIGSVIFGQMLYANALTEVMIEGVDNVADDQNERNLKNKMVQYTYTNIVIKEGC